MMKKIKLKKPSLRILRDPKFRYGSLSTAILCLCLAVLVALNGLFTALEKKYGWRMDFSFNAITTHSQSTRDVLDNLRYPVHIYALYERGNEDLQLFELLDRYASASELVTWEQAPISLNPTFLTRFAGVSDSSTITGDSLVVWCAEAERFRVLDAADFVSVAIDYDSGDYRLDRLTYENAITSAITYVTKERIPVVYMVQGHDELNSENAAALTTLLKDNHYDVRFDTLSNMNLKADDLLVFLAPVIDLTDSELAIVTAHAANGGSLLFACDYSDPIANMPNYRALLRSYGVVPLDGVVVADRSDASSYFDGRRTALLPEMQPTDITLELMLRGLDTLIFSSTRAFETPDATDASLHVTPMLFSGETSHLRSANSLSTSLDRQEGEPLGPFALALEAYRFSDSGDVSRAVAIGSTAAITSDYYYSMTHAQEFIIRTMEYLLGEESSALDIMTRSALRPALSAEALNLGSLMLVVLPTAVLAAALIILYPRRHL